MVAGTLKFLADMNLSPFTVSILCQHGYDVIRVNRVLSGSVPDEQIVAFARREGYVIITEDLDFSALLAVNGYDKPSVLTLRLSFSDPETVAERLLQVLPRCAKAFDEGAIVVVDDRAIRIRRLPVALPP
jgi:predicted nuclease of predicted toxin-antitoxin system